MKNGANPKIVLLFVVSYLFLIISLALGIIDVLVIRSTYTSIIGIILENSEKNTFSIRSLISFIDRFFVIFLFLGVMALVIIYEKRYRQGIANGKLWGHFFSVTTIQVFMLFICHLTTIILFRFQISSTLTLLALAEGILGLTFLFLWLWRSKRAQRVKG